MDFKAELEKRKLPQLLRFDDGNAVLDADGFRRRRKEILNVIEQNLFGVRPPVPSVLAVHDLPNGLPPIPVIHGERQLPEGKPGLACAGKAFQREILLTLDTPGEPFDLQFTLLLPVNRRPSPLILNISFFPDVPNRGLPIEEIIDGGFAVAVLCYKNVTSDDADFTTGIAPRYRTRTPEGDAPGKIAMWSLACSAVLNYLLTLPEIDSSAVAVAGHSRLGKTALLTGAYDERISFVFSNEAGCAGESLARGVCEKGETIERIANTFPFWFCPNFQVFKKDPFSLPFDQHFLVALTAPRYLCVGSAVGDVWADPASQFLSLAAAEEAWKICGKKGLSSFDFEVGSECVIHGGDIGFHSRMGTHFFSRHDWQKYMNFMKSKMNNKQ